MRIRKGTYVLTASGVLGGVALSQLLASWVVYPNASLAARMQSGIVRPADTGYWQELLRAISSEDGKVRASACQQFRADHTEAFEQMVELINAEEHDETQELLSSRHAAIAVLRLIGGTRALPVFIDNIECRQIQLHREKGAARLPVVAGYPCAQALVEIGPSAIPAIMRYVRHPNLRDELDPNGNQGPLRELTDKALELYAWVLIIDQGYSRVEAFESAEELVQAAIDDPHGGDKDLIRLRDKITELRDDFERRRDEAFGEAT